jgi:cullin-associated NEDD8-dissociated protein 1
VLISRFGDRENTVRLEIWGTYGAILRQTKVYDIAAGVKEADIIGGKRKRDSEEMEIEGTPVALLRAQVPALAKALSNQMKSPKTSAPTLQAGFDLFTSLLRVLPGSLSSHSATILPVAKSALAPTPSNANASLHLSCLAFLRLFFATHSPPTFVTSLPSLMPVLLKSLAEKHPRISSEAFYAVSALIRTVRPAKSAEWPDKVYDEALRRLRNHDTDGEVRAGAEQVLGDLWIFTPEVSKTHDRKDWEAICRTTGRTDGAVQVVTRVAQDGDVSVDWVNDAVQWILVLLKKGGRAGKHDAFICLEALIRR